MESPEPGILERVQRFVEQDIWAWEPKPSSWTGWAVRPLQLVVLLGEGFLRDQLLLRASALTYVSLLALIPLLAIAFSIVGAIGVSDDLASVVVGQIAAVSPEAEARILDIVANVKLGQLGTIGAVALLLTTILAIGNVEQALNQVWGVREQRDYVRRFTDYLAVLVTAPLLLALAISGAAAFRSQTLVQRMLEYDTLATLYHIGLRWVPTLVMAFAFSFLYRFLPNTHVRITSALLGGAVAAVLFTGAQAIYVGFNVGAARYSALVGGLAWLPLLFAWIYVSWAIVLVGAELAFAHQNLDHYRREVLGTPPGAAAREAMGLEISLELAHAFRNGTGPRSADALAAKLDMPVRTVRDLCSELVSAGIASPFGSDKEGGYQLGRASERVTVLDVLGALRGGPNLREVEVDPAVARVVAELEEGAAKAGGDLTLAQLVDAAREDDAPADGAA
ncbi:MAG TPA: YhjD/YihY/BrkB family envelope integrity protein [Myxococcota bacterium]|nr:YhjD/YihY/BrkB family envelope integrity protein [Myxococcota bacterium]